MSVISLKLYLPFFALMIAAHFETLAQNGQVFAAVKTDGKWGFIDTTGKIQIPFNLEATGSFSEGLAAVKYGGNWGYINKKGVFVLRPVFREAHLFHNGHARVSFFEPKDSAYYNGYINKIGTMITVLEDYETGSDFHDNLVKIVSMDVNGVAIGFKDTSDNWAIKPHYDRSTDFNEGKAAVALGRFWGFIDENNNTVVFPNYSEAWSYHEGIAYISDGETKSYIDDKGKVVFSGKYEDIDIQVQDGMISYREKGKIGFLNKKGQVVIPPKFNGIYLTRFQEGLAPIQGDNGKYGYINKKGEFVIAPQFDDAQFFFNNFAVVKLNGKYGYIDKTGNWVVKPIYDEVYEFEGADFY
jgi:hypothetical protein